MTPPSKPAFKNFLIKLGISPKNFSLYEEAFTHRSYLNETRRKNFKSYERLEFLGDSVLSFVISQKIFKEFPQVSEGELTNLRSFLVKTETLAKIAKNLEIGKYLLLSRGEEESSGRSNPSILADSFEAAVAAIFLDQGIEKVKELLNRLFTPLISQVFSQKTLKDAKSLLQEVTQERLRISPTYKVIKEEGPDHKKMFTVTVVIGQKTYEKGRGYSKQEAEEEAAIKTLQKFLKSHSLTQKSSSPPLDTSS